MKISYEPLFRTLDEKKLRIKDLYDVVDPTTATKFKKGESMQLNTIAKVCIFLDVSIDKVVRIEKRVSDYDIFKN